MSGTSVRAWQGTQGRVALLVILAATGWRWLLLRGSYFNQDDYYLTSRASQSDLTWSFLVSDTAGHVNPAQQLTYWIVARTTPFEWTPIAWFVLVCQTLTVVVFWQVLSRLLPGSWLRIPLLTAVAVAPLTLTSTLWWSAAMGLWPPLLAMSLAVLFLLRSRQDSRRPWLDLAGCILAFAFGLLWHERGILIAPVLAGVAVCLADDAAGWRRIVVAVRRSWGLWLTLVAVGGGFLVARSRLTDIEGGAVTFRQTASVAWSYLGKNVVPGIVSGPWQADLVGGAVDPDVWVVVVSLVLAGIGAVALLQRGGPARRWALFLLVGYVGSDLVLLITGRGGFGGVIGLDSRYSADIVLVASLSVALAMRGAPAALPAEDRSGAPTPAAGVRRGALVVTGVYVAGAAVGTALLVPHFQNVEDRNYFTQLRNGLAADNSQVIYDRLVPDGILLPLLGEEALISEVLAPLPDGPAYDQPSEDLRVVGEDGRLRRPELERPVVAPAGPVERCGYPIDAGGRTIRLEAPVQGKLVLAMGYFTNTEDIVELAVPAQDWSVTFGARTGPHEMFVVVPDFGEEFSTLQMRTEGSSTVCVTGIQAGVPVNS